jgi:hypothetical protein
MFDCTWPKDWSPDEIPKKASFDNVWPEHITYTEKGSEKLERIRT